MLDASLFCCWLTLYVLTGRIHPVLPKFQFKKKEGIIKKIFYERRDYESVDEKSLKNDEKKNSGCKGLNSMIVISQSCWYQ